jgi:hypothetical protein
VRSRALRRRCINEILATPPAPLVTHQRMIYLNLSGALVSSVDAGQTTLRRTSAR